MYVQLNGLMSLLNNHGKNNFLVLGTQYVALAWVLRRYGSAYDNSAFYPVATCKLAFFTSHTVWNKNPSCCWEIADRTYLFTVSYGSLLLMPVCFDAGKVDVGYGLKNVNK